MTLFKKVQFLDLPKINITEIQLRFFNKPTKLPIHSVQGHPGPKEECPICKVLGPPKKRFYSNDS